jgi:hypothetical protein
MVLFSNFDSSHATQCLLNAFQYLERKTNKATNFDKIGNVNSERKIFQAFSFQLK